MSGLGRVTQAVLEVIGPDQGHARVTQLYAEALGPLHIGHGRVTQLYAEALGPKTALGRITQLYAEPIGPPGHIDLLAKITQLYGEILGPQLNTKPCQLPAEFRFYGDASGMFYEMESMGAETVPVALVDTYVDVGYSNNLDIALFLTEPEQWITWHPLTGALRIKFSDGTPVRTIWVITNGINDNPPVVPIWASSRRFDLWKQGCDPA